MADNRSEYVANSKESAHATSLTYFIDKTEPATNIDMQGAPYYQLVDDEDSDDSYKGWDGD